jgi:hypothetical protein
VIRLPIRQVLHAAAAVLLAVGTSAGQDRFVFQLTRGPSGIDVLVDLSVPSEGTLIGDFDIELNPTGTRTKPGLFGSFGSTENVPVPTSLRFDLGGSPRSDAAGAFEAALDDEAQTIVLSGLSADLLAGGPLTLDAEVGLSFDSFRTRSPDSTYVGIPITLPIGDVMLVALTVEQIGEAEGSLTPLEPGRYAFEVLAVAEFAATVSALGNEITLPATPGPVLLTGEIVVAGETARLTASVPVELAGMTEPGLPLPTLPLDLPTILPPGGTAHLLLDLVVGEASYSFSGALTIDAAGVRGCAFDACDVDCSGTVDAFDIEPFIALLVGGGSPCSPCAGDASGDGVIDAFDIEPFIGCLLP